MNVLITGAAGGLGRAMAVECGRRGYDMFLTDVNEDGLRRVQTGLNRALSALGKVIPRTWVAEIVYWRWKQTQRKWLEGAS